MFQYPHVKEANSRYAERAAAIICGEGSSHSSGTRCDVNPIHLLSMTHDHQRIHHTTKALRAAMARFEGSSWVHILCRIYSPISSCDALFPRFYKATNRWLCVCARAYSLIAYYDGIRRIDVTPTCLPIACTSRTRKI